MHADNDIRRIVIFSNFVKILEKCCKFFTQVRLNYKNFPLAAGSVNKPLPLGLYSVSLIFVYWNNLLQ